MYEKNYSGYKKVTDTKTITKKPTRSGLNPFDEIFETADKSRKVPSKTFAKKPPKSMFGSM